LDDGTDNAAVRFGCNKFAVVLGPQKIPDDLASPEGTGSSLRKHEAPSALSPNQFAFTVTLFALLDGHTYRASHFAGVFLDQVAILLYNVCVLLIFAVKLADADRQKQKQTMKMQ
jgi:hypothetical protein